MLNLLRRRRQLREALRETRRRGNVSLLTRLVDPAHGEQKIPIHAFMATLAEYDRRAPDMNLDRIAQTFNMSAEERIALQEWLSNMDRGDIDRPTIHDVLLLAESERLDDGERIYDLDTVRSRLRLT